MTIELFYTRYQPRLGHMVRSDDIGEFCVGMTYPEWSTDEHAHADVATRLFRAWNCVRHDDHQEWTAFAAIVDRKRIVIGVEAVRELLATEEK